MNNRLISVIAPVYNGENYLSQSIESVLKQTYKNIEIIVVDDGSTDKTADLVKTYLNQPNIRYIHQKHGGQGSAMNTGVSSATGEFLSFIDHDDLWDHRKLQLQLQAFVDNADLDIVFAHMKNFAENDFANRLTFEKNPMPGYMPGPMLIRRKAFFEIGLFETNLSKGYFFPWFALMRKKGLKTLLLPKLLYHRRVHGDNYSICRENKDYKDYLLAINAVWKQRNHED